MESVNWEAIGIFAEVIGAIAVVVSLLYVGMQIKQSAASTRAQAITQVNSQYGSLMSQIALNGELATIYRIATEGGELDPDQATRYRAYLSAFFAFLEEHYLLFQSGIYDVDLGDTQDTVESLSPLIVRLLNSPLAKQWGVDESKHLYLADFRERVSEVAGMSATERR